MVAFTREAALNKSIDENGDKYCLEQEETKWSRLDYFLQSTPCRL
jgi:hypothetical protein